MMLTNKEKIILIDFRIEKIELDKSQIIKLIDDYLNDPNMLTDSITDQLNRVQASIDALKEEKRLLTENQ